MATKTYTVLDRIFYGAGDASAHRLLDTGDTIELDPEDEAQKATIESLLSSDHIEDPENPKARTRLQRVLIGYRQVAKRRKTERHRIDSGDHGLVVTAYDIRARIEYLTGERDAAAADRPPLLAEMEASSDHERRLELDRAINECDEVIGFATTKLEEISK